LANGRPGGGVEAGSFRRIETFAPKCGDDARVPSVGGAGQRRDGLTKQGWIGWRPSPVVLGALCGVTAAACWGAGFVAARHGVLVGLAPVDIAFHRFVWTGLLLLPAVWRTGFGDLGGIGWGRGLIVAVLAGPPQAVASATGFTLTPLGHGVVIQPASAALAGLLLATLILSERLAWTRVAGAALIVAGLAVFGADALATIGRHGLVGDFIFMSAGIAWAIFGTLLRRWHIDALRAAAAVAALSVLAYAPAHAAAFGFDRMVAVGAWENLLQVVVQGMLSGVFAIFLFARSVTLLGAGRAAVFPALVPGFALAIGFVTIGEVPSAMQLLGFAMVMVGFRYVLKQ
jgi:drug/metabolite transporter (DMT)-like permease